MKKILFILILCLFTSQIFSQEIEEEKVRKSAIGVGIGTGYSIDFSRQLGKILTLTAKYGALSYAHENKEVDLDSQTLILDGELDFSHVDLLLSLGGSLRLVVGAGYFINNNIGLDLTFTDEITISDLKIEANDIGQINISTEWGKILPYAGIGFGRAVPKTGFNIGFELGAFYDQKGPEVSLTGTNLLQNNGNQEQIDLLEDKLKDNKFLPYLNLRFAFSF